MTLTIINRYLIWELYKSFLAVSVILMLIIFATNLVASLENIVDGSFKSQDLWALMKFELIDAASFLITPSVFFAIIISLGKLYRDSEIIAMHASGLGPVTIYKSYLIGSIPLIALCALMVMQALPWSKHEKDLLKANQDRDDTTFATIETGSFQELQEGQTVFFAESRGKEQGEIRDIFIQNRRNGRLGVITAKEGYQYIDKETGDHYLVLKNGYRYSGEPGQNKYTRVQFYEYGIRIRRAQQKQVEYQLDATPTSMLWNATGLKARAELQYRLSVPLAIVAFTFLAIPLSRSLPRQGIFGRVFLAFIVYFTFMNLHSLAHDWMENRVTPAWMGMWWISVMAIVMAVFIELHDRYEYLLNWKKLTGRLRRL